MAVARTTKKSTTIARKSAKKVAGAKVKKTSSKPVKARATKTTKRTLKPTKTKRVASSMKAMVATKKSTVSRPGIKKAASPTKVVDFVAGILKQAAKAQKAANAQCKSLAKQVSSLDKQCAQLSHKQSTVKGRGLQAIDKQLSKLQAQSKAVGISLLQAENNKGKITSLVDFISELKPNTAPNVV